MMLLVGILMFILGLNLTQLSPRLQQLALALPTGKWFAKESVDVVR